jgi:TPR repeat protein
MKTLMRICILLLLATVNSYGQKVSMQKIEKDLVTAYKKITDERDSEARNYDSLTKYNYDFAQKLSKYISETSPSLNYKFESLQSVGVDLVTSDDGLFRIYSWDTWQGGSMHDYASAFQYKFKGKVYADAEPDTSEGNFGLFYSQIFTVEANSKTYYLAVSNGVYSNKDRGQSIQAFTIENGKLNNVKLFKTNSGLVNSISFEFDFFSVVDRPERPLKLIKYDGRTKTLYIPIVHEDGKVTNKFITYRFNGKYFERVKR